MSKLASSYGTVDIQSRVNSASPYKLVQMLYEGTLKNLKSAEFLLSQSDSTADQKKLIQIKLAKAVDLVSALQGSIDTSVTGELPHQLDMLYDYIQRQLLAARIKQNADLVTECIALLETLKAGWDQIESQVTPA